MQGVSNQVWSQILNIYKCWNARVKKYSLTIVQIQSKCRNARTGGGGFLKSDAQPCHHCSTEFVSLSSSSSSSMKTPYMSILIIFFCSKDLVLLVKAEAKWTYSWLLRLQKIFSSFSNWKRGFLMELWVGECSGQEQQSNSIRRIVTEDKLIFFVN